MDNYVNGIICTKRKLWKKKEQVKDIVDFMIVKGYSFKELVYGEPNDFVFTEKYEDIDKTLSRKGSFFGIRLKFERTGVQLEIESNTNGVDNVKYSIFADQSEDLKKAENDSLELKEIIKATSNTISMVAEYLDNHRKFQLAIVVVLVIVLILAVNNFVPIVSMVSSIFMFSPLLFLYLLFVYFRRR